MRCGPTLTWSSRTPLNVLFLSRIKALGLPFTVAPGSPVALRAIGARVGAVTTTYNVNATRAHHHHFWHLASSRSKASGSDRVASSPGLTRRALSTGAHSAGIVILGAFVAGGCDETSGSDRITSSMNLSHRACSAGVRSVGIKVYGAFVAGCVWAEAVVASAVGPAGWAGTACVARDVLVGGAVHVNSAIDNGLTDSVGTAESALVARLSLGRVDPRTQVALCGIDDLQSQPISYRECIASDGGLPALTGSFAHAWWHGVMVKPASSKSFPVAARMEVSEVPLLEPYAPPPNASPAPPKKEAFTRPTAQRDSDMACNGLTSAKP